MGVLMRHGFSPGDTGDLWLCGWRVRSALAIPDLPPWRGDDREPDVTIAIGAVPDRLDPIAAETRRLQVGEDGRCRLGVRDTAAYLIDALGSHVTVDPAPGVEAADVRLYLLGRVFAILCYRRGLLPLHASAVRIGDRVVAFSGVSGVGKSTLAAALVARGHAIVADDVTAVDVSSGSAMARPAFPCLRLSRASIVGLAMKAPSSAYETVYAKRPYAVSVFAESPAPLGGIYLLRRVPSAAAPRIEPVGGLAAAMALSKAVYRRRIGRAVAGADTVFAAVLALAGTVPVYVLEYGTGFDTLERLAGELTRVSVSMSPS